MGSDEPDNPPSFDPVDYFRFAADSESLLDLSEAARHRLLFGATGSGKTSGATPLSKYFLTGGSSKIVSSVKEPTDVEEIEDGS